MNHISTKAIILRRIEYQEADRIVRLLTPDQGKVSVIAKGVRRPKSKLAGGIEIFSTNDIIYIKGRSDMGTLVSSRADEHYPNILKDLDRTNVGYECIKKIDNLTEDHSGGEYYEVLHKCFIGLNDPETSQLLVEVWFLLKVLSEGGRIPNLDTGTNSIPLAANKKYIFDFEAMMFSDSMDGIYTANHIKIMRLACIASSPIKLRIVNDVEEYIPDILALCRNIESYIT